MKPANQNVIDFIEHHGTKGMKWGVRRSRGGSGTSPKRGTARTAFEKHPKHLTSVELEKRIRRMEMEKRYNELNKRDVSKGEKMASQLLTQVGTGVAATVLTGVALYGAKHLIKQKFGSDVADQIIKRKK